MAIIGQEKKPHPFSKEAREMREQDNISDDIKSTSEKSSDNDTLKAVLARLEKLEAENQALKWNDPVSIARSKKEIYKWPWDYSFSLWGWKPVISWMSYRLDQTKDWEFKNQFWQFETNHYMKLELADGTILDWITNYNFVRDREKSKHMKCKVLSDEEGNTTYEFDTEQYGIIKILSSKFIN